MSDNIKSLAGKAVAWTALGTGGRLALQFVYSIVMARLLTPADFGVMAVMMVINGIIISLIDGGFSQALIQNKSVGIKEVTAVFYLGLVIGIIMMGIVVFLAPFIASFFNMPILRYVAPVLSLDFIVRSFSIVQSAMLTKELKFKELAKVSIIASLVASALAVYLAWQGWGVWSLVIYSLTFSLLTGIGLWTQSPWRPRGAPEFQVLTPLFRFGFFILLTTLLKTLFDRINTILIGKYYSPVELGYYTRAESTQALPANLFLGVVSQVAFPVMSTFSQDFTKAQAAFKKASLASFYLYFPAMIGIFAAADNIVPVLYGKQWAAAIPMVQLYALGALMWFPKVMNIDYLKAIGRSRVCFALEFFQKFIGVIAAFAMVQYGIMAMLGAFLVVNVTSYFLTANIAGRTISFGGLRQIRSSYASICAAFLMGFAVWGISHFHFATPALILILQVVCGGLIYFGLCHILKITIQKEIFAYIFGQFRRRFA